MSILAVGVLLLSGPACEKREGRPTADIPRVQATLALTGPGLAEPVTFTYAELAAMEMTTARDVLMRTSHGKGSVASWEGPTVAALLARTQLKPGPMNVTLIADDGYEIEATIDDLKDALIALKHGDGQWLVRSDQADCAMRLVPPHKPANFWLEDITEMKFEPAPADDESE